MAAVFALAGLPPFSLFVSEILIVQAAWTAGHPPLTLLVLLLLLLAFASLLIRAQGMLFGQAPSNVTGGEQGKLQLALLAAPIVLLAWVGIALPQPLRLLLNSAAEVIRP
jgi:hydrogenase-4 component F